MEAACPQNLELCKAFRLVVRCLPKTYKYLSKRCPFTLQKGVFYTSKEHLLPCERASFTVPKSTCYLQFMNLYYNPSYALFSFHNKQISLPLHYYNNTIKTTTSQFSCHSYHSSPHHNALITSSLYEMLKVTATKNKTILGV